MLLPETELLLFMLASIGATFIITTSHVLYPIRSILKFNDFLYDFITCNQCVGFWVGLGYAIYQGESIVSAIALGCIVSLLSFLLKKYLNIQGAAEGWLNINA